MFVFPFIGFFDELDHFYDEYEDEEEGDEYFECHGVGVESAAELFGVAGDECLLVSVHLLCY